MGVRPLTAAAALCALIVPHPAAAQGLGLDLTDAPSPKPAASGKRSTPNKAAPPELGIDLSDSATGGASARKPTGAGLGLDLTSPAAGDLTAGPPILVVPLGRADGKPDLETYRTLCPALKEKLGGRIVSEEATLTALERLGLRGPKFGMPGALPKLAEQVKAGRVILFSVAPAKIEVDLYSTPDAPPDVHLSYAWTRTRVLDRARAREITADILKAGGSVFGPSPVAASTAVAVSGPATGASSENVRTVEAVPLIDIPPLDASAPSAPPPRQEGVADIDEEQRRESGRLGVSKPLSPPVALLLVGLGTSLRTFKATTPEPVVPRPPGATFGLGAEVAFFPVRLSPKHATSWASGFAVEGYYRRTFAGMVVHGGPYDGERCSVDDDAVMAGGSYRYDLGGRLPSIGLGLGWSSERTLLSCKSPVLSTRYRSIEVALKIDQPLIGHMLRVELGGGPRFLITQNAPNTSGNAFVAELWLAWRPMGVLFARGGARVNGTWATPAQYGVPVSDVRTFVGLEVGAAL